MTEPLVVASEIKLYFALERLWPLQSREAVLKWLGRLLCLVLVGGLLLDWFKLLSPDQLNRWWSAAFFLAALWLVIYASILFARAQLTALWLGKHRYQPKVSLWDLELSLGNREQLLAQLTARLADKGTTPADQEAAKLWLLEMKRLSYFRRAWWRWENLAKIPGLAKDWHYGETYVLERYGHFIEPLLLRPSAVTRPELAAVEQVLNRRREANVILVGERGANLALLERLAGRLATGVTWPALEGKRLFLLLVGELVAQFESQAGLSEELLLLAQQAAQAGNVILVIDDLPRLSAYLSRLGTPLATLLDRYLAGASLTVIGMADPVSFHGVVESDAVLMNRFEVVRLAQLADEQLLSLVTERLNTVEEETGLIFTYPAARAISQSLSAYFAEGERSNEIDDLLEELVPSLLSRTKGPLVTKADILAFVKQKTKIPMGEVTEAERAQLLALPSRLKERVIGQDRALEAVASAVRRSRAATRNAERPIGAFLFLGPTGVGKTETAKALSAALFGDEEALLRLDMSEYAAPESLNRLIGSFESGEPGILAKLVREHPYGILLLDEFEKTDPQVMNLFLQIFDEGFFTDMSGRRVNMRSLLLIATSNAGADLIWDFLAQSTDLASKTGELLDQLIKRGIFKPELLNRFDAVIIYEPLNIDSLRQIARRELAKLARRLLEQGITLVVTDHLVEALVKHGTNRQFGARPLRRLIQDTVEDEIAKAIISGRLSNGRQAAFIPSRQVESNLLGLDLRVE